LFSREEPHSLECGFRIRFTFQIDKRSRAIGTKEILKFSSGFEFDPKNAATIRIAFENNSTANTLDRLWASDYSFTNPGGVVMTKAQRLASLRTGDLKLESYSRDEETIRTYGTAAVVTYRSTVIGHKTGVDIGSKRRVTTVLVKKNGRWQVVAQQSTRIAQQ